ncbi:hypothetical protein HC000_12975 [Pseudoalteromonas sp. MIP2626]|nr:hypothetical protein [Pseudoalteromonas sp. MIP2626]
MKELCLFQKKSKRKAGDGIKHGKYPFYTSSQRVSKWVNEPDYDLSPSLIFGTGGLPSVHITSSKFSMSGDCIAITPVDAEKVDAKYIYFYLSGNIYLLEEGFKGAGLKHISKAYLENILIPLPPLETQKKIAAVLEKADQLRKDCKLLEQELNSLAESVFIDMFGDPVTNPKGWDVKNLIDLLLSKPQIGTTTPSHEDGTQKVVRVGELGKHEVNYKKCGAITLEGAALERYKLFEGDYLLARAIGSRNHLGKASLFVEQNGVYVYDSHVMRLRFNSKLMPSKFFYELMKTNGGRSLFLNSSAQTAVQFNINAKQISQIELPVPPIELQNDYLEKLDKIKYLFSLNNANTSEQNSNFESLMQKAFKGELNL